jgi:flagellin-like protein
MTRKGISPLVAVIMLIAFTLIVAGILAGWATRFAETQREQISYCVDARILLSRGTYDPSTDTLRLVLYNYGKVDLTLSALLTYSDIILHPEELALMPKAFNISAGDTKVFTILNVTDDLEKIEIRSDDCPGTQDILRNLDITGLRG